MTRSDAELVERTLAGDLAAFSEIVARHERALGQYALAVLGTREDAEEALQDTFLRAFRALQRFRAPWQLRAWLFRILVNRCRSMLRRRLGRPTGSDALVAAAASPENVEADVLLREEITHALDRLDPLHREAVVLRYVDALAYDEMAKVTGASQPALRKRVERGVARLRDVLREGDANRSA